MPVSVMLIDDHELFRDGLGALLRLRPEVEVVAEAPDAEAAYGELERSNPDVIVMDVSLPGVSGIAATREMLRRDARRKILLLSMHTQTDFVVQGFAAGATGYALKHQPSAEIVSAILDVAHGRRYLCSRISKVVVEDHLRTRRGHRPPSGPCDLLSPREQEIFDLLVRGFHNGAIALKLCISVKTVETHRAHILKKLGLHSVVELVRYAALHNLIAE